MPTNVTPDYKKAEAAYKDAREPREQLVALREMLRTIPKHKGTEHLQAGIKTKIRELNEELAAPRRAGRRGGPIYTVRRDGAGQIALLGPPNAGKSSLHAALTGSGAAVGAYPFTTHIPQPGMAPVADVGIQLIDLPPIAAEPPVPWIANALQPADGALLVTDLSDPACAAALQELIQVLEARKVFLHPGWPARAEYPSPHPDDPFIKLLPCALVAAKADLVADVEEEAEVLMELVGIELPLLVASATRGQVDHLGRWLFDALGVVRVYTVSEAGRDDRPYTIRRGQTVADVAGLIHKDFVRDLKYGRLIRPGQPDRRIGRDFRLEDGDRIELRT